MKYLNLGCGNRLIKSWTNIDFASDDPSVISHNLLKGVPFEPNSFDGVYHSHVLEHFMYNQGKKFIEECFRVLKPGGTIRVAIPDLEVIARNYIKYLEEALAGNLESGQHYDWTLIEMYDQVRRNETGGEFSKYICRENIPNENFVYQRNGYEARSIRNNYLKSLEKTDKSLKDKIFTALLSLQKKLENQFQFYKFYRVGKIRMTGEVHLHMYDQYSLGKLLNDVGFINPRKVSALESAFDNWETSSYLDIENGVVRKPDSLFMEATKPLN